MKHIAWSDDFKVGVEPIDRRNSHLIGLIQQAQEALLEDPYHICGCNLIDELIDYVSYHFANEEIWMSRRRYERLSGHVGDHLRCMSLIIDRNKQCRAGAISCLEMLSEIFNTLVPHIVSFDAGYTDAKE